MKKITFVEQLTFFIALFCAVNFGYGQIVAWEMDTRPGNDVTFNATTLAPNLNISTLSRGIGLTPDALGNAFSSTSFTVLGTQANAVTNDDYLQFQVSASSGYQVSISTLDVNFRRSNTGPNSFIWSYSTDGVNFTNIGTVISFTNNANFGVPQVQINLSTIPALQNVIFGTTITFRLYGWGATNTLGTFAIGRQPSNDLSLGGTVALAPPCPTTVTWNGSAWSNGTGPTLSLGAELNGDYDTSIDGSFTACSLTVKDNATLNVANNTFVEVQNDITVDSGSSFIVQPYGAVVQINNAGTVINNGTMSVIKKTAYMAVALEYTYWSSPVFKPQIGAALTDSDASRRYLFNALNFLDATAETGNNNAIVAGQDDIDDNGDDWQWVSGATVMQPGVGYASTHDPGVFAFAGQYDYSFDGLFNTGIINVPVYRNDSELNDNNWNFIGNPYPSAIDADLFLAANSNIAIDVDGTSYNGTGYLDGAIFLWSQDTDPSPTANGNEALNFSDTDYAIINAAGELAGGDGVTPNRYIPSGQGFFVAMSNSATPVTTSTNSDNHIIAEGSVTFNNSMRILNNGTNNNNGQFFKNTNTKSKTSALANANKLWVNLTSDNGVFNQILVSYINGATNNDDGMAYDTHKFPTKGASLYSIIENSTKKFAIQGKAANSINEDETIQLGFKTTINVATLYTLSIAKLQGDFLTNSPIFLIDNLLNKVHDLWVCDYTFTSEVGEFNSRFEIAFTNKALSVTDVQLNTKAFKIVELQDDLVQFNTNNNLTIKAVNIYDLLGRALYQFKGENTSETYRLSNLNNTVYIAKVALSDGTVVTKKAVKK